MSEHSILSASGAHRWLVCPPSALINHTDKAAGSAAAQEGTAAHAMAECKLRRYLQRELPDCETCAAAAYCTKDTPMQAHTDDYVSFIREILLDIKATCADPAVLVEVRLDYSHVVPDGAAIDDGYGTGDCVIVADGVMYIIDFKYGQGVLVEAEGNPQMMLYAIGSLKSANCIYDISEVEMIIYQPRRENISRHRMTVAELDAWARDVCAPAAAQALKGEGEYQSGEHCRFCRIAATCRARAEANLELAKHEFATPSTLLDAEIAEVLRGIDELVNWANAVKSHALALALEGKQWPGFKLVEGRTMRKFVCDDDVLKIAAQREAILDDVAELRYVFKGITDMEKTLGKERFQEVFGHVVARPQGKPTLVPETDKRPPLNLSTAKMDFAEGGESNED